PPPRVVQFDAEPGRERAAHDHRIAGRRDSADRAARGHQPASARAGTCPGSGSDGGSRHKRRRGAGGAGDSGSWWRPDRRRADAPAPARDDGTWRRRRILTGVQSGAMSPTSSVSRTGEYAERGDYHRHLSADWEFYPTYLAKLELVRAYLQRLPRGTRVLDAGCGEGVLVEEHHDRL